jgi:DMSO/TMAO reductase YedYZ molybdopterin-dependent catalytic subunit
VAFVYRKQRRRTAVWIAQLLSVSIIWSMLPPLSGSPASVFAQSAQPVVLRVSGEVPSHLDLSSNDLAAFQRQTVSVTDEHGTRAEYAGAPVAEILRRAGAPLGKELKGPNMALGVLARGSDGYRVLFSLMEFDAAFNDQVVLVADHRDGKLLDTREGPLRLIVAGDKRGARWVRGVIAFEVVRVR